MNNKKNGFTIIELIVVIAIMATLSGIILTNLSGIRQKAKEARAKEEGANVQKSLMAFYEAHGDYPGQQVITANGMGKIFLYSTGEPYLIKNGDTYWFSEILKLDFNIGGAPYFGKNAYYSISLGDSSVDPDLKIGCAYFAITAEEGGCYTKNILCEDCPGSCGFSAFYPICW